MKIFNYQGKFVDLVGAGVDFITNSMKMLNFIIFGAEVEFY